MPQTPDRKTGYLRSEFRLFDLSGLPGHEIPYHYHDFHKILYLRRGRIGYGIEGRQYRLRAGDIVLVRAGELHRPDLAETAEYERLILYISPEFGREMSGGADLLACFDTARLPSRQLRIPALAPAAESPLIADLRQIARAMAAALSEPAADSYTPLWNRLKVTELLISLNRRVSRREGLFVTDSENPLITHCLDYIDAHLCEETLSVDAIAASAFVSRSYLMHRFKAETGRTIGDFITERRLYTARRLMAEGAGVTQACYESGFKNYAAFYYAFRKKYGRAPQSGRPAIHDRTGQPEE